MQILRLLQLIQLLFLTSAFLLPQVVQGAAQIEDSEEIGEVEEIQEIVVTADFRDASQLEIPASLSIVSEAVIRARNAEHLEDVIAGIPNVNFAGGTGRARFFQIRGIGERSQFVDPINPAVGILIDGVDMSGIGSAATLFDVEQVEVLRGPQGTRYGANALAGLVNIKTKDPSEVFTASFESSIADYDTASIGGTVSGPLGDALAFRLAAQKHRSDGYTDNAFLGRDDVNARDETTVRGKLEIEAWANNTTTMTLFHMDVDNGYDAFSLDNSRVTLSDEPGHDRQETTALAIDSSWQLDAVDVEILASGAASDLAYGFDEDWTYTGIHPAGYTSTDDYVRDRRTASFEARLLSNESSRLLSDRADWLVGIYTLSSNEDLRREYTFLPGPFASENNFDTVAAFTQLDVNVSDDFLVTVGLRLENRSTDYVDSEGVTFSPEETLYGGRLALKWLREDSMVYASLARGYKAGGFNTDGSLDSDLRQFDSEFLWELETGIKGTLLSGQLGYRTAIFYDIRRDQQVKSSIVRDRGDGTTEFIDFFGNAAEGNNLGLELETDWQVTDGITLTAGLGLLDTEFDEFINAFGEDYSGREQAQAPGYMYTLAANFVRSRWFANLSLDGKDDFYFSDRHNLRSTGHTLLNARLGYDAGAWSISLWGRNLTDEDYTIRGFGSFGNDPRKNYIVEPYVQFGEPRIVGASFDYSL
ncbi:MAG: TonB-dependent receptor plug domain-containing protein [Pseudohongiellaceae bacterium]